MLHSSKLGKIEVTDDGYNYASTATYQLYKMGIIFEDGGSVANCLTGPYGGDSPYATNPFQTEADDYTGGDSKKSVQNGNNAKKDIPNVQNPNSNQMNSAIKNAKSFAQKAKGFAKSSVNAANNAPESVFNKSVHEKITNARQDPKTLGKMAQDVVKMAGKGAAVAGIATVSLPAAAAAVVGMKAYDTQVKKQSLRDIQAAQIKLDAELQKAEQEGDLDKKADLLIAKRQFERTYSKIKLGIDHLNAPDSSGNGGY